MRILIFIFFSLIFLSNYAFVNAHEISTDSSKIVKISPESTLSAKVESDYALPYPGMLSDNPLYFVKAIRDRVIEILTSDPVKKAEFYLLTSDKRLNEGSMLFDKGSSKYQLAESTISKGENYFEKGIAQLQFAKDRNLPVDSLIQKYHISSHKHYELIGILIDKSDGSIKIGLSQSQKRILQFGNMLEGLESK